MPVRQFRPRQSRGHHDLVERLLAEWRTPNPQAAEPMIIERFDNGGNLNHVYVVWSD